MKRKFEERGRSYEASMNDDDLLHRSWNHNNKKLTIASPASAKSPSRPSRLQRRVTLSPSVLQKPKLRQLSHRNTTRPVSPDPTAMHSSSHNHQQQFCFPPIFIPSEPSSTESTTSRKNVRFADSSLVQVKEIQRISHNHKEQPTDKDGSTISVPKSTLFYSKHDYMKFYVRERSRLAFQDLTKRICHEQERRIRNRQRTIPPYFVALNFWNAIMTINELGRQVKQQQQLGSTTFQQQQQFALYRQQKRRRRHLVQTLQQQQQQHVPTSATTTNTSHSIPNHLAPANLRHISLNQQVKPRAPRRHTVIAAVA